MMRTWQARLETDAEMASILGSYADLYGKAERSLFADLRAGHKSLNGLKCEYQPRFGITARQFNAIRIGLQGKMRGIIERRPDLIQELEQRIGKAKRVIAKVRQPNKLHQKKRRLANLEQRGKALKADQATGAVRLCFGSRKLFRAQFHLTENGYASHEAWLSDWRQARSGEFMLVGSKDETAGNQSCQVKPLDNDRFGLKLRLPNAIGKTLHLTFNLPHGTDYLTEALALNQALTYRFVWDAKGWRLFISTDITERSRTSIRQIGRLGIDINADHLAVAELDRHGNIIDTWRLALCTYGKSKAQAMAIIGEAVKQVIAMARETGKPIAIEKLAFGKKKSVLENEAPRYARMLSGFAYSRIVQTIKARAFDAGIEVIAINPACTSIIGRHKFAKRYGVSNHQAAAAVIGRRAQNHSESPNRRMGDQVTFALPVRNRAKHVWSFWRNVARVEAAHGARLRLAKRQSMSAVKAPDMGSIRGLPVESRHASRLQHCSASAMDISQDVPF